MVNTTFMKAISLQEKSNREVTERWLWNTLEFIIQPAFSGVIVIHKPAVLGGVCIINGQSLFIQRASNWLPLLISFSFCYWFEQVQVINKGIIPELWLIFWKIYQYQRNIKSYTSLNTIMNIAIKPGKIFYLWELFSYSCLPQLQQSNI